MADKLTSTPKAEEQLKRVVDLFSSRELPGHFETAYLESLGRPSDGWSMCNRLLMLFSGTSDARGFRQWAQVNRHPKKGCSAIYILGPRTVPVGRRARPKEKEDAGAVSDDVGAGHGAGRVGGNGDSDVDDHVDVHDDNDGPGGPASGEGAPRFRAQRGGGKIRRTVVGFRCIPVFRYEDTEGEQLKTVRNEPRALPPLAEVAERWGVSIRYDATAEGEYGSFSPERDEIRLCAADAGVFFHELAHKGHSKIEPLKPGQDPEQEAVAQLCACVLARLYDHEIDNASYDYIAHYAKSHKPEDVGRLCYRVIGKAERVLALIVGEAEAAGGCAGAAGPDPGGAGAVTTTTDTDPGGNSYMTGVAARCSRVPALDLDDA